MSKTRRYWSTLPPELLSKIAASLDEITDRIRFGSVCKSWNSASKSRIVLSQPSLPWLLLPSSTNSSADTHKVFSLWENKIYTLHLPETHRTTIYESSHGYVLTQYRFGTNKTAHLLNPITRHHSHLPRLPKLPSAFYGVRRWRLLTLPHSTVLMLSIGGRPYLIEKQQAGPDWGTWREMASVPRYFCDEFSFHKGCFFVLDCNRGVTFIIDPHSLEEVSSIPCAISLEEISSICCAVSDFGTLSSCYLVESSSCDELFLVIRAMIPARFQVFRLDHGEQKWEEVRSIGEDMMFVGYGNAVALSARDFKGRRGNCIYFVDFGANGPALFDIERDQVEDVPHCQDYQLRVTKMHPPTTKEKDKQRLPDAVKLSRDEKAARAAVVLASRENQAIQIDPVTPAKAFLRKRSADVPMKSSNISVKKKKGQIVLEEPSLTPFAQISAPRKVVNMKIKVLMLWYTHLYSQARPRSITFIAVDMEGSLFEFVIPDTISQKWSTRIKEGKVYILRHVLSSENEKRLNVIETRFQMNITKDTKCVKINKEMEIVDVPPLTKLCDLHLVRAKATTFGISLSM